MTIFVKLRAANPWAALLKTALAVALAFFAPLAAAEDQDGYANVLPSLDGVGKSYMGRPIAHAVGVGAADWLERDEREQEEGAGKLLSLLDIEPTDVIADVGAGTGYFSFRLSGMFPGSTIYAEDIQQGMIDIIETRKARGEGPNVIPVLGTETDLNLPPQSIDLIFMVDVYHEMLYPREMGEAMMQALKPGGRIALVEYRGEDPGIPIKPLHKMTEAQARKEMEALGLTWISTDSTTLPIQHLMIFKKQ
jgi:SAM-dependent methyltransferase